MSEYWNKRYVDSDYAYGEEPNVFFAEQLNSLKAGTIILPCDGEGRNGVFAAKSGWNVYAFDSSEKGKTKAMKLAEKSGVEINYIIEDAVSVSYANDSADVVALIYAHLPPDVRKPLHQQSVAWLKPGGRLILEAFNPTQLHNSSGGPKDIGMLYTEKMLREDFKGLRIEFAELLQTSLDEGKYHEGKADIIRFAGVKI